MQNVQHKAALTRLQVTPATFKSKYGKEKFQGQWLLQGYGGILAYQQACFVGVSYFREY